MSQNEAFWFFMGALAAAAAAFVAPSIWRGLASARAWLRYGAVAAFVCTFTMLSLWLYASFGSPPSAVDASRSHLGAAAQISSPRASSLEEATRTLASRLARDGGSDAEWALLAQSFEHSGDAAAAAAASQHRVLASAFSPMSTAQPATATSADAQAVLERAQRARRERRFADAQAAFEQLIPLHAMTADAWADYADVLAAASGSLRGAPAKAIDKALATNPKHMKALWLHASLALEEKRHSDALIAWRKLRTVIADASPDARIIDANIAEAEALSQGGAGKPAPPDEVAVYGHVDVDPALKRRGTTGMTLFVYAKAAGSAGPPLAVLRMRPATWPVAFRLDDSLAMLPERRLSGFDKVVIEARLSASGDALAKAGDLQATSGIVSPRTAGKLALTLSKVVGG